MLNTDLMIQFKTGSLRQ